MAWLQKINSANGDGKLHSQLMSRVNKLKQFKIQKRRVLFSTASLSKVDEVKDPQKQGWS